jgi:pimeloyl-ACP methyl ester carboxylesterase
VITTMGVHMSVDRRETEEPILPIPAVWLLHGKGGSPAGTVSKIEMALELHWPGLKFVRPMLPHHDPSVRAEESVDFILCQAIPPNALVLGVSLGGLVAARLQELGRSDLQVITISSPTWADGVNLQAKPPRRMAFYSSGDDVINDRIAAWPELTSLQRNFDWLNHDTDQHLREIVRLVSWYIEGMLSAWVDKIRRQSLTRQERDEIVWKNMSEPRGGKEDWNQPWRGGRPRDFAEISMAMKGGSSWDIALSNWLHDFVRLKDRRCLDAEPPTWMSREHRALLAGVADFFSRRFGLSRPVWVDKPEYFLPELEYIYYCETHELATDDPEYLCWPPLKEQALYRMIARTPRELLRRNVVYEARSLTVL